MHGNSLVVQWSGLCPKILKATEHTQKKKKKELLAESESIKSLSFVRLFVTPWAIAHQAPLSTKFSRQEYWRGLPFPSLRDPPDPGFKSRSLTLQVDSLTSEPLGKPQEYWSGCNWSIVQSEVVGGLEGWVMGCEGWKPSPYSLPQVHRRHSNCYHCCDRQRPAPLLEIRGSQMLRDSLRVLQNEWLSAELRSSAVSSPAFGSHSILAGAAVQNMWRTVLSRSSTTPRSFVLCPWLSDAAAI